MTIQQILDQWPQPQDDWEEFTLPYSIGNGRPEFLGAGDERKILMRYFKSLSDNSLNGHIWFSECCFGPPGHVHGGISAFVFDEALGSTAWMNGHSCVAIELTIKYLNLTPLNKILNLKSKIDKIENDVIHLNAEIFQGEDIFSTARGLFKKIDSARFLNSK